MPGETNGEPMIDINGNEMAEEEAGTDEANSILGAEGTSHHAAVHLWRVLFHLDASTEFGEKVDAAVREFFAESAGGSPTMDATAALSFRVHEAAVSVLGAAVDPVEIQAEDEYWDELWRHIRKASNRAGRPVPLS
jgi:hypothetical protein